jgi:hypothetical protein
VKPATTGHITVGQRDSILSAARSDAAWARFAPTIFEELLIDQDRDDHATHIAGQTYSEPVRDLLTAADAHRARITTNGDGPADNGRPARTPCRPHPAHPWGWGFE